LAASRPSSKCGWWRATLRQGEGGWRGAWEPQALLMQQQRMQTSSLTAAAHAHAHAHAHMCCCPHRCQGERLSLAATVVGARGNRITLRRGLPFDVSAACQPEVHSLAGEAESSRDLLLLQQQLRSAGCNIRLTVVMHAEGTAARSVWRRRQHTHTHAHTHTHTHTRAHTRAHTHTHTRTHTHTHTHTRHAALAPVHATAARSVAAAAARGAALHRAVPARHCRRPAAAARHNGCCVRLRGTRVAQECAHRERRHGGAPGQRARLLGEWLPQADWSAAPRRDCAGRSCAARTPRVLPRPHACRRLRARLAAAVRRARPFSCGR
jgi:hypothetical protein